MRGECLPSASILSQGLGIRQGPGHLAYQCHSNPHWGCTEHTAASPLKHSGLWCCPSAHPSHPKVTVPVHAPQHTQMRSEPTMTRTHSSWVDRCGGELEDDSVEMKAPVTELKSYSHRALNTKMNDCPRRYQTLLVKCHNVL